MFYFLKNMGRLFIGNRKMQRSTVYETPYLSLKVSKGKRRSVYYTERKGVNSVAIVITRNNCSEVYLRKQPLIAARGKWVPCPITGSMDHPKENPEECAIREVLEETGYKVPSLEFLTCYIVGTTTNERCYLYHVDVTGLEQGKDKNKEMRERGENVWYPFEKMKSQSYSALQIAYWMLTAQKMEEQQKNEKTYRRYARYDGRCVW